MAPLISLRSRAAALTAILVSVLAGLLLVAPASSGAVASAPARACSCQSNTLADSAAAADAVFSATLQGSRLGPQGAVQYAAQTVHVYKGSDPGDRAAVIGTAAFRRCAGPLRLGTSVVFFVRQAGNQLLALPCGGSLPLTDEVDARLRQLPIGDEEGGEDTSATEAAFTDADTDDPTSLTRLAAPGVALVIIGLLGLLLTRRRRSTDPSR